MYYNLKETESRILKTKEILRNKNLDAALIYFDELNVANGWYLSGWCGQFEKGAILVPQNGDPWLLGGPESEPFAKQASAIKNTRSFPVFMVPDEEYPVILMTGRILYHYTTRAMTGKTPELMEIAGESFIEMNIVDADKLGIAHGDRVRVSSRRGSIETTARVGTKTSPGESWMPFHFPDGNANWLTNAALDKYARIPEYKVCAVKIEKA